jgi:Dolichyl-phosphate-mannose-protein mannosyltransferase
MTTQNGSKRPLRLGELMGLALLAAVPRLANLGTFSMWLDEILQTLQTRVDLPLAWQALKADAVHPPLDGLISWTFIHLGATESARRLLPIALGVATVVLLARWAANRFGYLPGLVTGALAALSPLHVHYSQELRPYSLGLFFCALALCCYDAALRSPGPRTSLILWLACLGCLSSFYFAALIFIPLVALALSDARRPPPTGPRARQLLRHAPLYLAALAAAYLPWIGVVWSLRERPIEEPAGAWTGTLLGQRWQFLSVGGIEGAPLTWGGLVVLAVALGGAVARWRCGAGRAVLFGALAGTVGVELLLFGTDHWTNGRYSLAAWPFLTLLTALGIEALAGRDRRLDTDARSLTWRRWRLRLAVGLLGIVLFAQIRGIGEYYRGGRPQWRRVAQAVAALHRPGEPIIAANRWTEVCLGYYLEEVSGKDLPEQRQLISIDTDPQRVSTYWEPDECALLVLGGYPSSQRLESALRGWAKVRRDQIAGVQLFLLDSPALASAELSPCRERFLPPALRHPAPVTALAAAPRSPESLLLEFDGKTTRESLLFGWSGFETSPDGTTFVWAQGRRAGLGLHLDEPRDLQLRLDLWPLAVAGRQQRLVATLNSGMLGECELQQGRQTCLLAAPADRWRQGENFLELEFAYAVSPSASDPRRLAVAVDRLTLVDAVSIDR